MMMNVGDTVFLKYARDYHNKLELRPAKIVKIGKIYFYVVAENTNQKYKINKETMRDHTNTGWGYTAEVYLTEQDYKDVIDKNNLASKIYKKITSFNALKHLNLDQLKRIETILDEASEGGAM